jgi:chemotaxis protein methyltransferase CheR
VVVTRSGEEDDPGQKASAMICRHHHADGADYGWRNMAESLPGGEKSTVLLMLMITNEQFSRTRRLALRLAGIELFDRHRELIHRRSLRLGILDGAGFDALLGAAEDGDPDASRRLIGLVTTKFTGFYRHPRHFEVAAEHALRAVHRRGQARLWSTAAATGEEPYTLAMELIEVFRRDDPPVTILATDINEDALIVAQRGEYCETALRAVDPCRRERFFAPTASQRWRLALAVRHLVEFRVLNLASADWPVEGPFDVIFCRNVLMYLEAGCRYLVLERMASLLAPDGVLIMDPVEYPGRAGQWFAAETQGVYPLRPITPTHVTGDRAPARRLEEAKL